MRGKGCCHIRSNFDGAQQLLKADFGYFLFYPIICAAIAAIIIRLTINDAITLLTADGRLFRRAFSLNLLGVSVCRLWLLLAIASRIANWHPCNWNSVCKLATRSPASKCSFKIGIRPDYVARNHSHSHVFTH